MEHLESVAQDTIERMAQLGVTASMQPVHCDPAVLDNWKAMLGDDRAVQGFPWHRFREAGVPIALASNCNPGTSYTTSQNFNVGTAVLQMHLTLAEAVRAATLGGAIGLRAQDRVGSLEVGKRADLHVLDAPAAIHLAYRPGMPLTHAVWRAGRRAV